MALLKRISTPRFVPFDHAGRCRECKSSEVELDFIVTKEGVTIYCTRIKSPAFIPFDAIYDLPGHCFFKIKNKGRVFNIQHGVPPCAAIPVIQNIQPDKKDILLPIEQPQSPPAKKIKQQENTTSVEEFEDILDEFFVNMGNTTTPNIQSEKKDILLPIESSQEPPLKKIKQEEEKTTPPEEEFENILQDFFDNIGTNANTTPKELSAAKNIEEQEVKNREKRSVSEPLPFTENLDNSPLSFHFSDAVNPQSV